MKTANFKNVFIAVTIGLVIVSCGGNSSTQQKVESNEQNDENTAQTTEIREQTEEQNGISYELVKGGDYMFSAELFGLVEGKKHKIDIPAECIRIVKSLDFDEDGFPDVLMENISACGGNGAANSFFFVSYKGNGGFQITKEFGYSWNEPLIEKWDDKTSVVVENDDATKERYILQDGKAVLVESTKKTELVALKEIKATDFEDPDDVKELRFDLDGDGKDDIITCTFWERWGIIQVANITFSSGIVVTDFSDGCERIGVLATKTNKIHDLVCGDDLILRWDGKTYKE